MVNVNVLSRDEIEKVDLQFLPVISVVGSGTRSVKLNNPLRVLTLVFDDVEYGNSGNHIVFNKGQAEDILEFIRNLPPAEDLIVMIHCEAGISRSAGIARGLEKCGLAVWMNLNRMYWDLGDGAWRSAYHPNQTVVSTIFNTYNEQLTESAKWELEKHEEGRQN